jgi:hypothetical protein
MTTRTRTLARFALALMAAVSIFAVSCDGFAKESRIDHTFEPAKVKSVKGASRRMFAAIARRLAGARRS